MQCIYTQGTHSCKHTHACTNTCIHAHIHTRTVTHTYIHTHTQTHTHTTTHTHNLTNTHTPVPCELSDMTESVLVSEAAGSPIPPSEKSLRTLREFAGIQEDSAETRDLAVISFLYLLCSICGQGEHCR